MKIEVNNCGNCIFRDHNVDFESVGKDSIDKCSLLYKITNDYKKSLISVYDSWEDENPKELETTLSNCPLKDESIEVCLK